MLVGMETIVVVEGETSCLGWCLVICDVNCAIWRGRNRYCWWGHGDIVHCVVGRNVEAIVVVATWNCVTTLSGEFSV